MVQHFMTSNLIFPNQKFPMKSKIKPQENSASIKVIKDALAHVQNFKRDKNLKSMAEGENGKKIVLKLETAQGEIIHQKIIVCNNS